MEKQLAALRQKEAMLLTELSEEDAKVKTVEDEMHSEKQQIDAEWEKIKKRESELQDDIVRKCYHICSIALCRNSLSISLSILSGSPDFQESLQNRILYSY